MEEGYQLLEYHHQIIMHCDATVQAFDFYITTTLPGVKKQERGAGGNYLINKYVPTCNEVTEGMNHDVANIS